MAGLQEAAVICMSNDSDQLLAGRLISLGGRCKRLSVCECTRLRFRANISSSLDVGVIQ
jgi:hypothetical protein